MKTTDRAIFDLDNAQIKSIVVEHIRTRKGPHWIEIKKVRGQRSLPQNAYFHGVIIPFVADLLTDTQGEDITLTDAKEFLREKFLKKELINKSTGEVLGFRMLSTTELDTAEFSQFIEQISLWCGKFFGRTFPPALPTEYRKRKHTT